MKAIYSVLIILILVFNTFSQDQLEKKLSGEYSPLELVSITAYASFDQTIKMLSAVSELVTGKTIVSSVSIPNPIGVEIIKMPYMEALNLLVYSFDLTYEVKETSILIRRKVARTQIEEKLLSDEIWADFDTREIKISAIFFEADVENSRKVGIDWSVLLSGKGITFGSELRTESVFGKDLPGNIIGNGDSENRGEEPGFDLGTLTEFTTGEFTGTATALLRLFEAENLGEIISSPTISVRDGQKGRIQIGEDFSIKQRDFSGNVIDRFYSAGTIIEVTPYVYNKEGVDYILVKLMAERSSFFPTELTTVVKKTQAASDILMLDGEETIIGGLYINEETTVRNGIPFLKDLPWWVFGIRFLTGSDEIIVRKKEVIIVLHVELLPTLEQRSTRKREYKDLIRDKIREDENEIRKIKPKKIDKEIIGK
ncbi:MAG: type II secretion system protein GspD [Promethearchaeota archaeon]|jgi:type IV pilus assembly protein PilQ